MPDFEIAAQKIVSVEAIRAFDEGDGRGRDRERLAVS